MKKIKKILTNPLILICGILILCIFLVSVNLFTFEKAEIVYITILLCIIPIIFGIFVNPFRFCSTVKGKLCRKNKSKKVAYVKSGVAKDEE